MWELDYKESWVLKNWCFWIVVLEKALENPLDSKEVKPVNFKGNQSWIFIRKDWCWSWNSNTLATWCKELTHWKRPWCWDRLTAGGEEDNRGWDGWMTSLTQWTWIWASSGSWWWAGGCSPWGCKESDTTERLNWTELNGTHIEASGILLTLWKRKLRFREVNIKITHQKVVRQDLNPGESSSQVPSFSYCTYASTDRG